MCVGRQRKLDYGDRLKRRKKEKDWRRKNAKCPVLFCLIDPIGQGRFLFQGKGMTHDLRMLVFPSN